MPRHKLPPALAHASGAALDNPKRYAGQHENDSPVLGNPPSFLTDAEKALWEQFKHEVPWLKECHRALMEVAVPLRTLCRSGLATASHQRLLVSVLREIGATPSTEGKVDHGHKVDPYDEFDD